jgi:hypothetical protein
MNELNEQKRRSLLEAFHQQHQYYVFYYTHKDNLSSIREHGILSRNEVKREGILPTNESNNLVQEARSRRGIHDYVNFYFTRDTPTTYVLKRDKPQYYRNIIFLGIELRDLFMDESITTVEFTDGNAASDRSIQYTEPSDIERIPWELIRLDSRSFTRQESAKRSSELLVKPKVKLYPNTRVFQAPNYSKPVV